MLHSPLITLLPQRHEPGQFVFQEHDFEVRKPRRGILAGFRSRLEGFETGAHAFIVGATLEFRGVELLSDACYNGHVTAPVGEGIRKLAFQCLEFLVEDVPAGVRVEEIAIRVLEFGMADVEASSRVGEVFHAFEIVFGEVGTCEGDELVYEVVVEVGKWFDGGVGRVCREVDGHFEHMVCGGRVVVQDGVHESHRSRGVVVCERHPRG